jgi:hypothetical protein
MKNKIISLALTLSLICMFLTSYSQKTSVALALIDTSYSNTSNFVFRVKITNDSFDTYWVQDTTILQARVAFPSQNLIHIFISKKVNGFYEHFENWKHSEGLFTRAECGDTCFDCIILSKGQSIQVNLKILQCCNIEKGRYRMEIGIVPPLLICNNCEQLGEITSNYVYFTIGQKTGNREK